MIERDNGAEPLPLECPICMEDNIDWEHEPDEHEQTGITGGWVGACTTCATDFTADESGQDLEVEATLETLAHFAAELKALWRHVPRELLIEEMASALRAARRQLAAFAERAPDLVNAAERARLGREVAA